MARAARTGGAFITFEGGEGSGKTTQIEALARRLSGRGMRVVATREPGGTPEAEAIRALLVRREGGAWSGMAESLLFFAARVMHVETLIRPALESGAVVLCDRFTDSTRAYQAGGRGLSDETIKALDALALEGFGPDLTFLLDIDPVVGLGRAESRLAAASGAKEGHEDRFERLDIGFHRALRRAYLEIAHAEPQRFRVVDATLCVEAITDHLEKEVLDFLGCTDDAVR